MKAPDLLVQIERSVLQTLDAFRQPRVARGRMLGDIVVNNSATRQDRSRRFMEAEASRLTTWPDAVDRFFFMFASF